MATVILDERELEVDTEELITNRHRSECLFAIDTLTRLIENRRIDDTEKLIEEVVPDSIQTSSLEAMSREFPDNEKVQRLQKYYADANTALWTVRAHVNKMIPGNSYSSEDLLGDEIAAFVYQGAAGELKLAPSKLDKPILDKKYLDIFKKFILLNKLSSGLQD